MEWTNSNKISDIVIQNIWNEGRYKGKIKMYLRR